MQLSETSSSFSVQAASTINALVSRVWSVLVDLEYYREWNTFVPSMQSSFQVGSLLTMGVRLRKGLFIKSIETITTIEPQRVLAWKTRSPECLCQDERFQVITAIDTDTTRYWTREEFTGILAPVIKIQKIWRAI